MIAIGVLIVRMLCDRFKSRRRLATEILVLRHQLNVLQRRTPRRLHLRWADRADRRTELGESPPHFRSRRSERALPDKPTTSPALTTRTSSQTFRRGWSRHFRL